VRYDTRVRAVKRYHSSCVFARLFSLPIGDVYSPKYIADPRSILQATRTQQTQDGAAAGGCVSYTLGSNRLMRKPE
jgi:hypothetical protein